MVSADQELETLRRGAVDLIDEADLKRKIARGPLTVKVGFDPSAPDIHLGHTVVLRKMRHFQDAGHRVVFVIGDFTGMIGDPSGKKATRPQLTPEEIEVNARTYTTQAFKILDPDRTVIELNSRWLGALGAAGFVRLAGKITVARILERDDFQKRWRAQQPIALHELMYPLAQGYDSVALGADVELGGTDQTFNLLVGRDLQRAHGQEPQVALTVPILEGLDGVQKMSKSLGNYVGITEPPADMYGKLMSLSDDVMFRYFELLTRVSEAEIQELRKLHPMEAKKRLARAITAIYHGEAGALAGEVHFSRVVQGRQTPEKIDSVDVATPYAGLPIVKVIVTSGLVATSSEARRLILQGAVEWDDAKVEDPNQVILPTDSPHLLKVGKRRFKTIVLKPIGTEGTD
jgi:tyrosyl-tRNA synthetase